MFYPSWSILEFNFVITAGVGAEWESPGLGNIELRFFWNVNNNKINSNNYFMERKIHRNRPLSRRLDRCDRVIQDEVGDSNGGNV